MKYYLRFFIGYSNCCKPENQFEYTHPAKMLVPRIGEHVWLSTEDGLGARYLVRKVEYDLYDTDVFGFVDVYVARDDEVEEDC